MATPKRPPLGGPRSSSRRPPPRPKTPEDYTPTPVRIVAPGDALHHLLNQEQGSPASVRVHPVPLHRFTSFGQLEVPSPTMTTTSLIDSWRSRKSALSAVTKRLSLNLELGKNIVKKKLKAVTTKGIQEEKDKGQLSPSPSSSSAEKLFNSRRLPKLQIPDLRIAVKEALNTACSTETQESPNFPLLELTPTSRELKYQWQDDDHPADVRAEFHNMFSARRRVRKGKKFGAKVAAYYRARPTWDHRWGLRMSNDNHDDRALLRLLTDTLQEQKDYATRLVQKNPGSYPGLEAVAAPGCTLSLYWQHKSSHR
ncbi:hypothetical protein F4803DRAFT_448050 [Xylaria telfairii]|nr:hypothetical protein F4803DRAFT_448050 [Xylaria telfairii]